MPYCAVAVVSSKLEIRMDEIGFIMAYESGELTREEMVEGFQRLINSGLAWKLQGHYGRTAQALIENGDCEPGPPVIQ